MINNPFLIFIFVSFKFVVHLSDTPVPYRMLYYDLDLSVVMVLVCISKLRECPMKDIEPDQEFRGCKRRRSRELIADLAIFEADKEPHVWAIICMV